MAPYDHSAVFKLQVQLECTTNKLNIYKVKDMPYPSDVHSRILKCTLKQGLKNSTRLGNKVGLIEHPSIHHGYGCNVDGCNIKPISGQPTNTPGTFGQLALLLALVSSC